VNRRICVLTGSRAEYGLLRWVMHGIDAAPDLDLQIIATGAHLSPAFGLTARDIEMDGFHIDRSVEMLLSSDTPVGVSKSMGLGLIGVADALDGLKPNLLVVLGDRYEMLSAVAAALVARVPVAHLHGGETTEGAFDDAIRHAVTKMSHLHFVAAEEYRQRVIQLGEHPDRVFLVGGLGIDSLKRLKLLDRTELESALGLRLAPKSLLVTYHPVTLDRTAAAEQMMELLAALAPLRDTSLIFTMPNADPGARAIADLIDAFVSDRPNARVYQSLGQLRYLSCLQQVDGMVGNSSSGLMEAPTLRKGAINIGDRQRGRLRADSVIDCAPDRASITAALQQLYASEFQKRLARVRSPYGDGGASDKIVEVLRTHPLEPLLKKSFYTPAGTVSA
jgi:GDP/UDP-N,N'-diacetylbacillosamine 2-epimerase (hydrolysing)